MASCALVPGQTPYGASKAAVNVLSEGLRSEHSETEAAVTVADVGAVGTNVASNSSVDVSGVGFSDQPRKVVNPTDPGRMIVDARLSK